MLSITALFERLPWRKPSESFAFLKSILGYSPKNMEYYNLAFRHSSCSITDSQGNRINNERLEFLGDSVLATAISSYLYERYPSWDEGQMSKIRSSVVQRQINNAIAQELGLERLLKVKADVTQLSNDVMGNTLEALIGAIFLDKGYHHAEQFIHTRFISIFNSLEDQLVDAMTNYKSSLLEWAQKHHLQVEYKLESAPKRNGGKFHYSLWVEGKRIGSGSGHSKKEAQQIASRDALQKLQDAKEIRKQKQEKQEQS